MPSTDATPQAPLAPATEADSIERSFSVSIVVSGIRCLLTYIVLPFVIPFLGLAPGVGPALGLVIGTVAIVANVASIRRFHRSKHRWRWPVIAINVAVIGLLVVLIGIDLADLVG